MSSVAEVNSQGGEGVHSHSSRFPATSSARSSTISSANVIGSKRVAVSGAFAQLKEEGAVELRGRKI